MQINEIFYSIQGEGTNAGRPCIFIRTSGCNLNCSWCDTKYHRECTEMTIKEIIEKVHKYNCTLVEVTGGEPLLQKDIKCLLDDLIDHGYTVSVETNGTKTISEIDDYIKMIIDIKCPSSGNRWDRLKSNLDMEDLAEGDEIKFVISNEEDFNFAKEFIRKYLKSFLGVILFSPVFGKMESEQLVEIVKKLGDERVRMQLQLHKLIWGNKKGV